MPNTAIGRPLRELSLSIEQPRVSIFLRQTLPWRSREITRFHAGRPALPHCCSLAESYSSSAPSTLSPCVRSIELSNAGNRAVHGVCTWWRARQAAIYPHVAGRNACCVRQSGANASFGQADCGQVSLGEISDSRQAIPEFLLYIKHSSN